MSSRRSARTIKVYRAGCGCLLYEHQRGGGGRLVKCFGDMGCLVKLAARGNALQK